MKFSHDLLINLLLLFGEHVTLSHKKIWSWVFIFVFSPQVAFALNCQHVRQLTHVIFLSHLSVKSFDKEVARRTLDNYVKAWDPAKIYFTAADQKMIMTKYLKELPGKIEKGDCSTIDDIFAIYDKRFNERLKVFNKYVDKKFDFSKDEYIDFDRKKMKFSDDLKEIENRIRKRIKFKVMQYRDSISDTKKISGKLKKHYSLIQKSHNGLGTDDVYGAYLDSFTRALDPHSDYFSPSNLEEFQIQSSLSFQGIGAVLRSEDGFTTIQQLIQGGAAQKSKMVQVEDKIVAVAQGDGPAVDVVDMELKDVVKLIRGPRDTVVRLTVRRDGKEIIAPIKREEIKLEESAAKSKLFELKDTKKQKKKIGYIELPSFYIDFEGRQAKKENFRSSSRDVEKELKRLVKSGVSGIILDLRSNGGGSLTEAINVTGLFSGKVPVVQSNGKAGTAYVHRYDHKSVYDGPLVVMIDGQSASASEISAGAFKDYERALIVGDRHTFGKGTVQNLENVHQSLGALKITISKFYRPSGESTQLRGVESDIVLPSILSEYEIGEKFYPYALDWEKVAKVEYPKFKKVKPYVDKLAQASQKRVSKDKDFAEIQKFIKEFKEKKLERTRISLKEEKKDKKEDSKSSKQGKGEKSKSSKQGKEEDSQDILKNDPALKETLRIAGDYISLLEDKSTKLKPGLDEVSLVEAFLKSDSDISKAQTK